MSECLLIDKKVLPSYFEKVVLIKERITKGESVSDACKALNLSRSTYYKYKDYVNRPTVSSSKHIILSLKLVDEPGVLSGILNLVASCKANIVAINQEMPIHNIAFVTLTISTLDMFSSVQELVACIKDSNNVVSVMLVAVE